MDYKKMNIEDIIKWCQENNQIEWLKEEVQKEVEHKVYPKVRSKSKNGKDSWKYDKTQPYTIEKKIISFVELKMDFCEKFMPEIIPVSKKEKKPSMRELIEAL